MTNFHLLIYICQINNIFEKTANQKKMKNTCLLLLIITFFSCTTKNIEHRKYIDLQGQWQFALDTADAGIKEQWYLSDLNDTILLPGTTDLNKKGFLNTDTSTMHLNRIYTYEGPAWYRKKVFIPENLGDKNFVLHFERTKPSMIWIDNNFAGSSKILQTPQEFDVTDFLTPGEHFITVRIDNDLKLTPYGNVHIYTDETQTNWNGILGEIFIEAKAKTFISDLQVFPDIHHKKIDIQLEIENQLNLENLNVELIVEKTVDGRSKQLKPKRIRISGQSPVNLGYELGKDCELWDEYNQALYNLTAVISNGDISDSKTVPFGMREFKVKGTQFSINGRTTFLRGKHEAAVFPMTGFPPMDVEGWLRVYKIAKSYRINHYRFHSYCPPEAAFTAADRLGIYLQAETPYWGELNNDTIAEMLRNEGMAMCKAYANHPSFVMFSHGNELGGNQDKVEENLKAFKKYDDRPLYSMGSNNGIGYTPPTESTEFFVGARIPGNNDLNTHLRLTHAFADADEGGILNTQTPSTRVNFDHAVSQMDMPLISHEIGQYQIYPDYSEIDKYTGVLRARNLEVFRERLAEKGMAEMDSIFQKASGAWSALCYKAEMEAAIRTEGMAGFQLLDLQDFPGQGTALVGILDAFMDSKEVVSKKEWLQSCNDVVILAEFPKYCWTNKEVFQADVIVANYSKKLVNSPLTWELKKQDGTILANGILDTELFDFGGLTDAGKINTALSSITNAEELAFHISVQGTDYSNSYPLWIYPAPEIAPQPKNILISEELNKKVFRNLETGGKVLFFPKAEDVKKNSFPGLFPPEFWNWGMFKGISEWLKKPVSPGTLGILTDPEHPVFNSFPTDFHTNWQWFSIIKESNSFILDKTSPGYRPIVQVVDNLERNHKLGLIFEFKVGEGKLLVCMSQLPNLPGKPEAVQFYRSIVNYMNSEKFNPDYQLSTEELKDLMVSD